jgi:hypothetical protein
LEQTEKPELLVNEARGSGIMRLGGLSLSKLLTPSIGGIEN